MEKPTGDTFAERSKRGSALRSFLAADRVPMWFTTFVLLCGAGGTYLIAPIVNAEFEAQKIRTDFVIRNYHDLRAKLEDFQGLYVATTQRQAGGQTIQAHVYRLQELVARTSAQGVAMMPLFTSASGPRAASQVTQAMNAMIQVLFANAGQTVESEDEVASYNAQVNAAMQALVPPLLELYVELGAVGQLRPTPLDTDLQ